MVARISTGLELLGFAGLTTAAFLVSIIGGIVAFSLSCLAVGILLGRRA